MVDLRRNTHGTEVGASGESGVGQDESPFERLPPAEYTAGGFTFQFSVLRIQETGGNRIIERERPYRDGAKLDDTGSKPRRWTLDAIFNNTIFELQTLDGPARERPDNPPYPDILNGLIGTLAFHETGNLVIPTIGSVRARFESYSRQETYDERDQALVQLVFCEDNEDGVGFLDVKAPSAGANGQRLGDSATFDAQSFGSWSEALTQVQASLIELEELVNAPGNLALDIESAAMRVEGSARRAKRTFSEASRPGRDLFTDPANSRGERKLTRAEDLAARQRNIAGRGRPQLVAIVFTSDTTIFRAAAFIGQDPIELASVNPELDPMFIPAGTPVKVFVTSELLNGSSSAT